MSPLALLRNELPLLVLTLVWGVFVLAGPSLSPSGPAGLWPLALLFAVMVWGASAVLHHAESLAERLGEPLGTLILTLAVVGIEVALISSVMLSGDGQPTLARDTMFAVLMIVLNGLVGLSLLLGALRFGEQNYNLAGARAFLIVLVPLAVFALILPGYTTSERGPVYSTGQAVIFSGITVMLYFVFLLIQTVRHRGFFIEPEEPPAEDEGHAHYPTWMHAALMVATMVPIVLLSKKLAGFVDHGLATLGWPTALGGVLIAMIVLFPEGMSAIRAARRNRLQRAVNLTLGAGLSTIGLTVPAALGVGLWLKSEVVLALNPANQVLLALTLMVSVQTFAARRTNVLHGAVHLVLFVAYLALIFLP